MNDQGEYILLFDGICNLCNEFVQFMIKRDPKRKFKFASLQSDSAQKLLDRFGLLKNEFDSFVLIKGDKYLLKSMAVLQVLKELGGVWSLFYIFKILPRSFGDFIYDRVAKSRYRIFGKRNECMMPTPDLQSRFL